MRGDFGAMGYGECDGVREKQKNKKTKERERVNERKCSVIIHNGHAEHNER